MSPGCPSPTPSLVEAGQRVTKNERGNWLPPVWFRSSDLAKRAALPLLCLGTFLFCRAELPLAGTIQTRSVSGQFFVQGRPDPNFSSRLAKLENNPGYARLDPKLVPISCERIKQILWRKLETTAPWRGKIAVGLYPANSANDPVSLNADQFRDGWQYMLAMPNLIERSRYVRALVQILLLEFANRTAQSHCAELPAWLVEGLTQEVLTSSDMDIILPPSPQRTVNGVFFTMTQTNHQRTDPLSQAHTDLVAGAPLNFQQLSWPEAEMTPEAEAVFRGSAHLFVSRLLSLKDGAASMRAMLSELPERYNWQFAFLHGFQSIFSRPLEVEKWWALQTAHFTGRELAQTWNPSQSWEKLDESIRSFVQVRLQTNDLPLQAEISLQTVLREWDSTRQKQALQLKIRELEQLRLRLAPEFVGIADDYRQTLANYLQNRDHSGSFIPFRKRAVQRHTLEEALRKLDALDARRTLVRPPAESVIQAKAESTLPQANSPKEQGGL
jgi:hypothetical protein